MDAEFPAPVLDAAAVRLADALDSRRPVPLARPGRHAVTIPQTLRIDALDVPAEVVAARAKSLRLDRGRLDEQRHQFLDLDTDSTCCLPGLACVACPPKEAS